MSQPQERVEYPQAGYDQYSSSHQPNRKSRAPPPPTHRNSQPPARSQEYGDYQEPSRNAQQDSNKGHEGNYERLSKNATSIEMKEHNYGRNTSQYLNERHDGNYGDRHSRNAPTPETKRDHYDRNPSKYNQENRATNQSYKHPSQEPGPSNPSGKDSYPGSRDTARGADSREQRSSKTSWEPKSQRQPHYNSSTTLQDDPSKQWVPKSQRQDPGGKKYKSQQDLAAGFGNAQQYASQGDLSSKTEHTSWEPRAQRKDGNQYHSQHDLSMGPMSKSGQGQYRSQHELNKPPPDSWQPKAQRKDGNQYHSQHELNKPPPDSWQPKAQRKDGNQYHSQHDLRAGSAPNTGPQQSTSQHDLSRPPSTSWEPRAQRQQPTESHRQSQPDLSGTHKSTSKSEQNLAAASLSPTLPNPVDIKAKDTEGNVRRYQRNSAYKPQASRHSGHPGNLSQVPAGSTQSLHNPRSLGHSNPALARSAVSLNPSANAATLSGQGDLAGGLSTSRLSLASQSIYRNPSLTSLVASNPSLYRTVSVMSLYEAGTKQPNTYFPVTITGAVLCCPIGVIGILFSVMAKDALDVRDYPGAVRWGSVALWTGVTFIIGGIVLILTLSIVLGLYFS